MCFTRKIFNYTYEYVAWLQNTLYQPSQSDHIRFLENDCIKSVGLVNSVRRILLSTYRVNKRNRGMQAAETAAHLFAAHCKVVADKMRQAAVVLWL